MSEEPNLESQSPGHLQPSLGLGASARLDFSIRHHVRKEISRFESDKFPVCVIQQITTRPPVVLRLFKADSTWLIHNLDNQKWEIIKLGDSATYPNR